MKDGVVSIPSESGLFLRCRLLGWLSLNPKFQSPQNRGYSSDVAEMYGNGVLIAGFNPLRIGAIPQICKERVPWICSGSFQSPQNRGYSSDDNHFSYCGDLTLVVSIPSESGLFLRSLLDHYVRRMELSFQSPQNRGYSSDVLQITAVATQTQVSIPSESGLFLRFKNRLQKLSNF